MIMLLLTLVLVIMTIKWVFDKNPGAKTGLKDEFKADVRKIKNWIMITWERSQKYNIFLNLNPYVMKLKEMRLAKYIGFVKNYSLDRDVECFEFEMYAVNKEYKNDKESFMQLIVVGFRDFLRENLGECIPCIYLKYLRPDGFAFFIAKNRYGNKIIKRCIERERKKELQKNEAKLKDVCNKDNLILGYDMDIWERYSIAKPISLNIEKHTHGLIVGASGSGKSYGTLTILNKLVTIYGQNILVYYFDFKSSEDTRYLMGYEHYYTGDNCAEGFEEFYREYCAVRDGEICDGVTRIMFFDEWAGFLLFQSQKNKKQADLYKGMLQEILLMGRSLKTYVWVILQRPDSVFIQGRENFMAIMTFLGGGVSPEMARMVGMEEETIQRIKERDFFNVGEAVVMMDGERTRFLKVPEISDVDMYKKEIVDVLTHSDGEP